MKLRIRNITKDTLLASDADIADDSEKRRTGLLKHTELPRGQGLLITPCEGVHTIGMKFPIDVLYLSQDRKVLKVRPAMPPWRTSLCLRAHSVLELPAGMAAETSTVEGDVLAFEKFEG